MLSVAIIPLPNFTLMPFAGFIDLLRLAADEGDRSRPRACQWTVMAPEPRPVRSSCGIDIMPWETLSHPERFDHVVVAGGLLPPPGRGMLDPRTLAFLRLAHRKGVGIIGICTGALALIEAGILGAGKACCVSWYHHQDVIERYPEIRPVADRLWVREGPVVTCAGGTAAIDLAATLVNTHVGGSAAQKGLHIMLTERLREAGAAQPQPPNTVAVADARVRRAMLAMEQNLSMPLDAEKLAGIVAISKRQLERLFRQELGVSLQAFGRDLRLSYAVWLMAHSRARISDVAAQCGFADAAHFSRVFRTVFGCPPTTAQVQGAEALHRMLQAWWPHGAKVEPRGQTAAKPFRPPASADRRPYL